MREKRSKVLKLDTNKKILALPIAWEPNQRIICIKYPANFRNTNSII